MLRGYLRSTPDKQLSEAPSEKTHVRWPMNGYQQLRPTQNLDLLSALPAAYSCANVCGSARRLTFFQAPWFLGELNMRRRCVVALGGN